MADQRKPAAGTKNRFDLTDLIAAGVVGALLMRYVRPAPVGGARRDAAREANEQGIDAQLARAEQPGRGRRAISPFSIPWTGWKDILWRVYAQITEDRLLAVAAGVVFYGLLAIFPAVTAFVSIYGLFADVTTVQEHLVLVAQVVPANAMGPIEDQVTRVAFAGSAQLSFAFLFSFGLALWSTNAGMKAIIDALNVAYDEVEKRSFIKLNLVSLAMTIGAIAAALVGIAAVVVFPVALSYLGVADLAESLVAIFRWPVLFAVLILALAVLYRFGPSRREPRWQWLSFGSVFAAFAWLAGSSALSLYLSNFANYNATYGSLAAGIGLMMWMWMSSIVILLGAELNAEIEHQTAHDTTVGREKPLGLRGAVVADTVGEAQD